MNSKTLVLMEQGLTVEVEGDCLIVAREGEVIQRVRPDHLSEVLLFGSIHLTPSAIALLLTHNVDTIFLTFRGNYRGRLVGRNSGQARLRIAQYHFSLQQQNPLLMARSYVTGKIRNQRNLLLRAQRDHKNEKLVPIIGALRRILESAETVTDLDTLRGYEGSASAAYFNAFPVLIRNPRFSFTGRNRRPPRDPVNALLSFGYTLLATTVESFLLRAGLDPMLGCYHQPEHGRPSLALDLMEEFRPVVVDSLVLRLINRREISPQDFENSPLEVEKVWFSDNQTDLPSSQIPQPVWLSETGRRIFFHAWSQRLHSTHFYPPTTDVRTLRSIMLHQVYRFAATIRGESSYEPFILR